MSGSFAATDGDQSGNTGTVTWDFRWAETSDFRFCVRFEEQLQLRPARFVASA